MADRATRPEDSQREVFDLEKDERWQARLAEARARRAIALREKANSETPPKPRPKPWEADGQGDLPDFEELEAMLAPQDGERPDFADRVKTLRQTIEADAGADGDRPGDNGGPALETGDAHSGPFRRSLTVVGPEPEDAAPEATEETDEPSRGPVSVAERYIRALSPDFTPVRPFVPETYDSPGFTPGTARATLSADETEKLARDYASTMKTDIATATEAAAGPAENAGRSRRRGVPALLLAGVCILAIVPFTKTMPPLEMGPFTRVQGPAFGLPPALGITSPMNEFPAQTVSGEWVPLTKLAPGGPLALPLDLAAVAQRDAGSLPAVDEGDGNFGVLGWSTMAAAVDGQEASRLVEPSADGLPGATQNAPVIAEEDAADAAPAYPEPLSLLNVTVLVPETNTSSLADDIVVDLEARGHDISSVKTVNLKITERNIRFFHEEDRGESARLAEAYGARLRDFTNFRPSPSEGTVEIWLAGEALPRQPVSRPAPQIQAQQVAPVPRIVIVQRQPSFLERLTGGLVSGHVGDGLPNPPSDGGSSVSSPSAPSTGTGTTTTGGTGTTTGGTGTTTGGTGATTGGTGTTTGGTGTTSGTGTTTGGTGTTSGTGTTTGGTGATTGGTGTTTGGTGTTSGGTGTTTGGTGTSSGGTGTTTGGGGTTTDP